MYTFQEIIGERAIDQREASVDSASGSNGLYDVEIDEGKSTTFGNSPQ